MKDTESVELFKNCIENWIPDNCPCRLCRSYIHQVGLIWFKRLFNIHLYYFIFVMCRGVFQHPVKRLGWSFFEKIVNCRKPLTIFAKGSVLDVWQSSEYASNVFFCFSDSQYIWFLYILKDSRLWLTSFIGYFVQGFYIYTHFLDLFFNCTLSIDFNCLLEINKIVIIIKKKQV